MNETTVRPIGYISSTLRSLEQAQRQGREGAPDAWLDLEPAVAEGLVVLGEGMER